MGHNPRRLQLISGVAVTVLGVLVGMAPSSGLAAVAGMPGVGASLTASSGHGGCGTKVSAGSTTLTPMVASHRRTVIVHVPAAYTGSTKVPLVLNMHGSGSTAAQQEKLTGMDATADARGFIVAYPQGLIPEGSGYDWNVPGVPLLGGGSVAKGAANDVAFLTQLVGVLEQRYCIDPGRVYATGFSGGARMASQLGCDAAATFAAIGPVSGLRRPTPCPATRSVPVISFHGTADPVDPYGGHGEPYWTYSVPQAAADWARQDKCSLAPASHAGSGFKLTDYRGCAEGATVELYTITGEGHDWPGGPRLPKALIRLLGPQSSAVDADQALWTFFAAHPRP